MAPPLLALDAEAVIAGPKGQRRVPIADFFTGVRRTVLAPDELLVELVVPAPGAAQRRQLHLRHTPRRELDIAVVGVASQLTLHERRRARRRASRWPRWRRRRCGPPRPSRRWRASRSPPEAIERAAELAVGAAQPISDQRGSAEYRRHLVRVLTRRTLTAALERATAA